MSKFQCSICGTIHEGFEAPEKCPVCKAPSSKFTIIDKGAPKATKLQKINDEDYEIIKEFETNGFMSTVEWYQENYGCDLNEAKDIIKTIKEKYNVVYQGSEEEIREMLNSIESLPKAIEWYENRYAVDNAEATKRINEMIDKIRKESYGDTSNSSGNGCAITILIAITSTLSIGSLIAYYI